MKVVATSDWHLDEATSGVDRYEDTCKAIDVSVDVAIDIGAFAYVMCGDLTDPNTVRAHRAVTKAAEVKRRLHDAGILPIFVAGNHDVIEDGSGFTTMSPLAAMGGGLVFERPELNTTAITGVAIIALPFTATSHDYDPAEFIRKCAAAGDYEDHPVLILGHLNLHGITAGSETTDMPRGRNVYWPLEAIEECFPNAMVVGGHYHTPQEFKGVHIIGSTARLRFDERDNETGYSVLEV